MNSITPIDGRYFNICKDYSNIFSENAYFKYRYMIEIKYYNFLINLLKEDKKYIIDSTLLNDMDLLRIKEIETNINHDVKAIEYFIIETFGTYNDRILSKYIHFGLTSNDINSVAYTLQFNDALNVLSGFENKLINEMYKLKNKCINITYIAKTHGQKAVPTQLDKELFVYIYRLNELKQIPYLKKTKFGGAVGNLSAHKFVFPNINWDYEIHNFISQTFNLQLQEFTTQIDNYDELCMALNIMKQRAVILKSFADNIWLLISDNIFIQDYNSNHVGSSTMPQKINPISIENAFGNYELLISLIESITRSLPQSRHQRDLKDSTIMRNMGLVFSYYSIFLHNLFKGINLITPNLNTIQQQIENSPETILEGIQCYLKIKGLDGYNMTKNLFRRNNTITKKEIDDFIISTGFTELLDLTVDKYGRL